MIGWVHPVSVCSANFRYVVVPTRSIQLRSTPRSDTDSCGSLLFSPTGEATR